MMSLMAGNQLPDPLIDFLDRAKSYAGRWESVTRPLDRLLQVLDRGEQVLGISHQTP